MTPEEVDQLKKLSRAVNAPAAHVTRARALLLVAKGKSFSAAARECGQASGDTVAGWVARFNEEGMEAIVPRHGGGRKPSYTEADRRAIVETARELQEKNGVAGRSWSLAAVQQHLLSQGLPSPSIYTLWNILRDADLRAKPNGIKNNRQPGRIGSKAVSKQKILAGEP